MGDVLQTPAGLREKSGKWRGAAGIAQSCVSAWQPRTSRKWGAWDCAGDCLCYVPGGWRHWWKSLPLNSNFENFFFFSFVTQFLRLEGERTWGWKPSGHQPFSLSFHRPWAWGKADRPLDNWLFLFSTRNRLWYSIGNLLPLGFPACEDQWKAFLLLFLNWEWREAANNRTMWTNSLLIFSLYWSASPLLNTQGLLFWLL